MLRCVDLVIHESECFSLDAHSTTLLVLWRMLKERSELAPEEVVVMGPEGPDPQICSEGTGVLGIGLGERPMILAE